MVTARPSVFRAASAVLNLTPQHHTERVTLRLPRCAHQQVEGPHTSCCHCAAVQLVMTGARGRRWWLALRSSTLNTNPKLGERPPDLGSYTDGLNCVATQLVYGTPLWISR